MKTKYWCIVDNIAHSNSVHKWHFDICVKLELPMLNGAVPIETEQNKYGYQI